MQRDQKERVYGPYKHGNRYRVVLRRGDGATRPRSFASLADAEKYIEAARGQTGSGITVTAAVEAYCKSLADRGLKFGTYERAEYHLAKLLQLEQHGNRRISWVARRGAELYETVQAGSAVDSHRNALAAGKSFGRFCTKRKWLRGDPFADVDPVGRRKKGKPQLHVTESRQLLDFCLERCKPVAKPEPAAVIAALLLGPRSSEVVLRDVRDLDDGGRLLWIPDSKTESGKRRLEVPEVLRPLLLELARDRIGAAPLFRKRDGERATRHWLNHHCKALTKKATGRAITPHGLRGTHSSLARAAGVTGELVAAQLGHASTSMQERTYATAEAMQAGASNVVALRLAGNLLGTAPVAGNAVRRK